MKKNYGSSFPNVDYSTLEGKLIVIEGSDGAGRTTQINLLKKSLENMGYPSVEVGLKRSGLVSDHLTEMMQTHLLCYKTLTLLYATDFIDQLENVVIPSLKAGFIVLADRYIYSLLARSLVRNVEPNWIKEIYSLALIPDLIIYLVVRPQILAERTFMKRSVLDYWEAGLDLENTSDMHSCFIKYQTKIRKKFLDLSKEYNFIHINGEKDIKTVHNNIKEIIFSALQK